MTLNDSEYQLLTQALDEMAGLVFDDSRRTAVTTIVGELMKGVGAPSVEQYVAHVRSPAGVTARQALLDAVTIQETHFFRNLPQIEALRQYLIPELLSHAAAARRPITIWSAGCSTGEEPYTLAMLLLEAMQGRGAVPVRIVGTDVSAAALRVAEEGRYGGRTMQLAEAGASERWFDPVRDDLWQVKPEVRDLVEFSVHNLVTDPPPFDRDEVDLLVCRNVTIYFSRGTTQSLVHRFYGVLRDGGYLVLGHAETLWQMSDAFSLVSVAEAFVYRRDSVSARPSPPAPRLDRVHRPPERRSRLRAPGRLIRPRLAVAPPVGATLEAARDALADGRYRDAVTVAAMLSAADPLSVEPWVLQGRALANLGDEAAAMDALRKAIYLDPSAGHAHFLLASTLTKLGDRAAAALSFAAAAETLPLAAPEALADLLDGRDVEDLVDLCRQLARPSPVGVAAAEPVVPSSGRKPR